MNFKSRTLWTADCLDVMRGMNSDTVDLAYLDPPFNSNRNYAAPMGSAAAGAAFTDTWSLDDVKTEWADDLEVQNPAVWHTIIGAGYTHSDSMQAYLTYMSVRLIELWRILKPTGSLYLHCDPTAAHYLKQMLDCVFGQRNFRSEIIWRIGWVSGFKTQKRGWIRNHDTILYYVRDPSATAKFNKEYLPYPDGYVRRDGKKPTGKGFPIEDTWNCHGGDVLDSIMIKSFSTEKTGWPTQKPLALLERIIKASSNSGDMVFDPFCGCATALVAAERLDRQWAGVDIDTEARTVIAARLDTECNDVDDASLIFRKDPPRRTDAKLRTPNAEIKPKLYAEQRGVCNAAGCQIPLPVWLLEIDHIVPRSKGGPDHDSNLQLLCSRCNRMKGSATMAKLEDRLRAA